MIKLELLPETTLQLQVAEKVIKTAPPVIAPKHITENGTYAAKEEGVYGFDPVTVEVDMTIAREEGRQAEYHRFWDAYLEKGNIRYTLSLFAGWGWNDETFKPKYSLVIYDPYMLFRQSNISDIGRSLKAQGVVFTIRHNILQYSFNHTASKTLDNIVFETPITTMYTAFGQSKYLQTIQCPIPVQDANIDAASFANLPELLEVRFVGTIASNLNFAQSGKLSTGSVESILGALKDRKGQTAFTLTLHKDVGAKLTNEQKAAITAKNWILVY